MIRTLPDIESYDLVVTRLFNEVKQSNNDTFDIYNIGEKIGLEKIEIDAMYYHLRRSDMIENANDSMQRFSKYGYMLQNGEINHGYVPMES